MSWLNGSALYAVALLALVLAGAGVAYSMWSQGLAVNSHVETGELDIEFLNGSLIYLDGCGLAPGYGYDHGNDWNATYYPAPSATQLDKDVGCTRAELLDTDGDGDYDTINVTLHNVYPWYYTHVAFKVHNNGDIPVKIWRVLIDGKYYYEINEDILNSHGVHIDVNNDTLPDIAIWWGDNFGKQLHHCDSADMSFDITVLQPAPQGSDITITIKLEAVQWNEYTVPSGG